VRKPSARLAVLVRTLGIGLVLVAIGKELRKPKAERGWHGQIAGFVPYDLRLPTLDRLRSSVWNPDSSRLLTPQPFGVGWSLNLARLLQRGRRRKK
jgi:hypothetical protein